MIEKNKIIFIKHAEYQDEYKICIEFNDSKIQLLDFKNFILNSHNPNINKCKDLSLFQKFNITDGDLEWNDYDLCFPIADLYENKNIGNTASDSGEAA